MLSFSISIFEGYSCHKRIFFNESPITFDIIFQIRQKLYFWIAFDETRVTYNLPGF